MTAHAAKLSSVQGEFFEISLEAVKSGTTVHFDVYADVEQHPTRGPARDLVLYAKAPFDWTERELHALAASGFKHLFIRNDDRSRFLRYMKMHEFIPDINYRLDAKSRITQVETLGSLLIEAAFLTDLSTDLLGRLRTVSEDLAACIEEDPRSILQLKGLADHDLYTYIHSVGVGTLAAAIALEMGVTSTADLRDYAFGGLLHDVGKKLLPLGVLNKPGPLTPEEWELMKKHPENGQDLLASFPVPDRVIEMVSLHHEKLDGSGYPHGLTRPNIPVHVQITSVADIFNALTTTRCYHRKRTRFEALMFMKHHLKGKISQEVFAALVRCLATEEQIKTKGLGAA